MFAHATAIIAIGKFLFNLRQLLGFPQAVTNYCCCNANNKMLKFNYVQCAIALLTYGHVERAHFLKTTISQKYIHSTAYAHEHKEMEIYANKNKLKHFKWIFSMWIMHNIPNTEIYFLTRTKTRKMRWNMKKYTFGHICLSIVKQTTWNIIHLETFKTFGTLTEDWS